MEILKEKIKNLYLELAYVRFEWNLLKELDKKLGGDAKETGQELVLSLKDALWYAVIMRIAKICEKDTEVNSIYKILNYCKDNPTIAKKKIFTIQEIEDIKKQIVIAITDESGENINLIKSWRDKYLAHYSKLVTPECTQKEFLITNKKLDHIIDVLLTIIMDFNRRFNININDIYVEKRVELLKKQFDNIYEICNYKE